ncbi:SHOCT domain-containing protein [Natronospora cellulosivora (SeqCode)]
MFYCHNWTSVNFLGGFGWLIHILFWVLLVTGIVYTVTRYNRKEGLDVMNVLKHEYALGNISREEYLERREELEKRK